MIDWLIRGWRPRAARIIAGVAVGLFGVVVFLTPGSVTTQGNDSALITTFSIILVAGGMVIIVGPDRINEMAKRSRRR